MWRLISETSYRNLNIHLNIVSPVPITCCPAHDTCCRDTAMCAPAMRYYVN